MKKIMVLLFILTASLTAFGSAIIVYANNPEGHTAQAAQLKPTATPSPTPVTLPAGTRIFSGNSNLPEVALTFDDGPSIYTPKYLSILKQYNIHATFFCIGQQVAEMPEYVQQEHADGNVVGNHSWDHPDLTTLTAAQVQAELSQTSDAIHQATGVNPTFFRPPYGAINNSVQAQADQLHLTPTLWDVDTEDWQMPGVNSIVNTALSNAVNGSIILMHDGGGDRSQTLAALPLIIKGLEQKGFKLVTMQQLANHLVPGNNKPTVPTPTGTPQAQGPNVYPVALTSDPIADTSRTM